MAQTIDDIIKIKRQLYPTGRAFRMPIDSYLYKLHIGLGLSEAQAYEDSVSIFNSLLPDNPDFTSDDATQWEVRLGLITNLTTPLADRMAAIRRKMAAPGIQPAHAHYLYLERQLQAAGFNVNVYENRFATYPTGYISMAPIDIWPAPANYTAQTQYGQFKYGQRKYGLYYTNMVANSIYQSQDNNFDIGNTFASTFFIGGPTLGTYGTVLASREIEFRQLILSIKQPQNIGFLFINYI